MNAQPKTLPAPVDWDDLYPGRFLKAADLKGKQVTLRIATVSIEELVGDKGPQIKGVIGFERTEKQWALNKTNGICLKEMFGKKVQEWVGRRVTLFPSQWDGEDCLRVWGSPELTSDKQVTISLPRKRPFQMTMHKTGIPAATNKASSATDSGKPLPSSEQAVADLRAAKTVEALAATKKTIWDVYAAAGKGVPLEIEATANELAEVLSSQDEGMPS